MSTPFDIAEEEAQIQSLELELCNRRAQLLRNLNGRITKLQREVEVSTKSFFSEVEHRKKAEGELAEHTRRLDEAERDQGSAAEQHCKAVGLHQQDLTRLKRANEELEDQQARLLLEITRLKSANEEKARLLEEQQQSLAEAEAAITAKEEQLQSSMAARRALVDEAELFRARLKKQAAEAEKLKAAGLQVEEEATPEKMQLAQKDMRTPTEVWAERICQLVREARERVYVPNVSWEWQQKWPQDAIDSFQPCKKMKNAVQNYVPGVRVTEDLEVVLVSGGRDAKSSAAALFLRDRSRDRSRSPRRAILNAAAGRRRGAPWQRK